MATLQGKKPAEIFREKFGDISRLIGKEPNFSAVTANLFAKRIITQAENERITQQNLDANKRGNELAMLLSVKIKEVADNSAQCLRKICDVFESDLVDNEALGKLGASMREELSMKEIKTPRQESEKNGDQEEPQTKDGATVGSKKSDAPKAPPVWEYEYDDDEIKKRTPKKEDFSEGLVEGIEYLLLPATDTEHEAVMYYLKQSTEDPEEFQEADIDGLTIFIGYYGKCKVIVAQTALATHEQGSVHAAMITKVILNEVKSIKYVVALGVCMGKDPQKQKLGNVIISNMICDFTNIRREVDKDTRRGGDFPVSMDILKKFKCTDGNHVPMPHKIEVSDAPIITTSDLIDNSVAKKNLFDQRANAKAAEMEGAGIMKATQRAAGAEAIVIKGIGDWGDGTKESATKWKRFAARASAHYVHAVLDK